MNCGISPRDLEAVGTLEGKSMLVPWTCALLLPGDFPLKVPIAMVKMESTTLLHSVFLATTNDLTSLEYDVGASRFEIHFRRHSDDGCCSGCGDIDDQTQSSKLCDLPRRQHGHHGCATGLLNLETKQHTQQTKPCDTGGGGILQEHT